MNAREISGLARLIKARADSLGRAMEQEDGANCRRLSAQIVEDAERLAKKMAALREELAEWFGWKD